MKKIFQSASMLAFAALAFTSCDPCTTTTCGTNATCNEGACICADNYLKDDNFDCVAYNDYFNGTYSGVRTCSNGQTDSVDVLLSKGVNENEITLQVDNMPYTATVKADANNINSFDLTIDSSGCTSNCTSFLTKSGTLQMSVNDCSYTLSK